MLTAGSGAARHRRGNADHGRSQKCAELAFFGPGGAAQNSFPLIVPGRAPQLGGIFLMQMQAAPTKEHKTCVEIINTELPKGPIVLLQHNGRCYSACRAYSLRRFPKRGRKLLMSCLCPAMGKGKGGALSTGGMRPRLTRYFFYVSSVG